LFSDDLLCLRSWHRTNQRHDSLLPRDLLWLTYWSLLPHLSNLPMWTFCCWWIPLLSCVLLASFHNSACFSNVRTATVVARNLVDTLMPGRPYVCPWEWTRRFLNLLYGFMAVLIPYFWKILSVATDHMPDEVFCLWRTKRRSWVYFAYGCVMWT